MTANNRSDHHGSYSGVDRRHPPQSYEGLSCAFETTALAGYEQEQWAGGQIFIIRIEDDGPQIAQIWTRS